MSLEQKEVVNMSTMEIDELNSSKINENTVSKGDIPEKETECEKVTTTIEDKLKKMYELNKVKAVEFIGSNTKTENLEKRSKVNMYKFLYEQWNI